MRDTDIVTFTGITDTDTDTDEHANTDTDFVTDSFEFEKEKCIYIALTFHQISEFDPGLWHQLNLQIGDDLLKMLKNWSRILWMLHCFGAII